MPIVNCLKLLYIAIFIHLNFDLMANGNQITSETANAMIAAYMKYMQALGVDMTKQTHYETLDLKPFADWLQQFVSQASELRLYPGVYPDGEQAGRLTVIAWPYNGDVPSAKLNGDGFPPYNVGGLSP